jgi:hypothetical protein
MWEEPPAADLTTARRRCIEQGDLLLGSAGWCPRFGGRREECWRGLASAAGPLFVYGLGFSWGFSLAEPVLRCAQADTFVSAPRRRQARLVGADDRGNSGFVTRVIDRTPDEFGDAAHAQLATRELCPRLPRSPDPAKYCVGLEVDLLSHDELLFGKFRRKISINGSGMIVLFVDRDDPSQYMHYFRIIVLAP